MEFVADKETKISWMWGETCLALFIVDTEIQEIREYFECDVYLLVDGKIFQHLDVETIEYICINKITNITLVTGVDTKNYLSSIIRYIKEPDGTVDFDKVYIETIRDIRR